MTAEVAVERLTKTYPGGVQAVRALDFEVAAGEVFGLLGPNGAGKSTTIGMLTTTIAPTGGRATLAGYDVARRPVQARAAASVVFQEPVVDRSLTARANLELHARLWGVPAELGRARIAELTQSVGLAGLLERAAGTLSGGQRRRLEIARALVSRPRVLFLDEPTVGLDPRIRFELLDTIAGLRRREGMTIILTTHYLEEAQRLCDRVAIMHDGRIVAQGRPDDLLAGLGGELLELHIDGDAARARRVVEAGFGEAFAVGATLTLPLDAWSAGDVLAALQRAGIATSSVTTRPPTLDDVYLRLTGAPLASAA